MRGLIQKSGYIKPGSGAGNYAEYIATRDGVELLSRSGQHMEYIAERPRSHGLFSNAQNTDLEKTMREVSSHPAAVWTFIYSLKREDAARETMSQLIREMESGICDCPAIEDKLVTLAEMLRDTKGKKVYGYLKKPAKAQVDAIVDELAQLPVVAECYEVWNNLWDELENYYKDKPRERLPLSQQKELKSIKNMVIREAKRIQLGEVTFEDEQTVDKLDEKEEVLNIHSHWQVVNAYREAKYVLDDDDASWTEQEDAVQMLEQLWDAGFTVVAHQLGKCWRDGLGVYPDDEKAELWFRRSAEAGNNFSQYALGKLLHGRQRRRDYLVAGCGKSLQQRR